MATVATEEVQKPAIPFGRWMQRRADRIENIEPGSPAEREFNEWVSHNSHTPVYPLPTNKVSSIISDEEILMLWTLQLSL